MNDWHFKPAKVINWQLCHPKTKLRNVGNVLVVVLFCAFFSQYWHLDSHLAFWHISCWFCWSDCTAAWNTLYKAACEAGIYLFLAILACHWFWFPCSRKEVCQTSMPSAMLGEHSTNSFPRGQEEHELLNAIDFISPIVEKNVRCCEQHGSTTVMEKISF